MSRAEGVRVDAGRSGTRVAAVGPDGRVALLGVLPAGTPVGEAMRAFGTGDRMVPPSGSVGPGDLGCAGRPGTVLDVGSCGSRLLVGGRIARRIPVGGRDLDAAVRALLPAPPRRESDVTALREALSLRPAATIATTTGPHRVTAEEVREAITPLLREIAAAVPPGPVLIVGGVARTPALAALLDATGTVAVAPRPELAALVHDHGSHGSLGATHPDPGRALLPPAPRPARRARTAVAGLCLAGVLLAVGLLLPEPLPADRLVQYGYAFALPQGWAHTGGDPERRRTLLTPVAAPDGTGLIAVERTPLGYDAGAEPARARAELRTRYDAAVAAGELLDGFREEGGAVRYRERLGGGEPQGAEVQWSVRFAGTDQLGVGCRAPSGGSAEVERACAAVAGSLEIRDR